ncbi:MAG: type I 3-dehydroquinate dehydratase [Candidatus Aenigmarchaeota archaeon]|nr:type I 3-dehydroquinate dehydratase [Candidatus Aenigmarchaeota archaeon]
MGPYITASIKGRDINEAIEKITKASRLPYVDFIETRFDCFEDPSLVDLEKLFSSSSKPLVFTNMPKWEDGYFKGSEKERISYIKKALVLKPHLYHLELGAVKKNPDVLQELDYSSSKQILSYHDFNSVPNDIEEIMLEMCSKNPFVNKIAVKPNSEKELKRVENLHELNQNNKIIIAMGPLGKQTRTDRRNYLTFGALEKNETTAPGQLTVEELAKELGRI